MKKYKGMFNAIIKTLKNGIMMTLIAILMTITLLGIEVYAATGLANSKNEDTLVRLAAAKAMAQNTNRSVTRDQVATMMGNYVSNTTVTEDTNNIYVKYNSTGNTYTIVKNKTYTVTYNANGGSGAPGSQTKILGTNLTLSSTKPTRPGYIFLGWYTAEYKDHPLYYYADRYSDLKDAFGYDEARLYNHWINNGINEDRSIAQYNPGDSYTSDVGLTLYAGWQIGEYIIYNAGAGCNYTGGFTGRATSDKIATITTTGSQLVMQQTNCANTTAVIIDTTQKINVTGYSKLCFEYTTTHAGNGHFTFGLSSSNSHFDVFNTSSNLARYKRISTGGSGRMEINISGLTGDYYVFASVFGSTANNTLKITKIWLENSGEIVLMSSNNNGGAFSLTTASKSDGGIATFALANGYYTMQASTSYGYTTTGITGNNVIQSGYSKLKVKGVLTRVAGDANDSNGKNNTLVINLTGVKSQTYYSYDLTAKAGKTDATIEFEADISSVSSANLKIDLKAAWNMGNYKFKIEKIWLE